MTTGHEDERFAAYMAAHFPGVPASVPQIETQAEPREGTAPSETGLSEDERFAAYMAAHFPQIRRNLPRTRK